MIYKNKNTYGLLIREYATLDYLRETFPSAYYRHYTDLLGRAIDGTYVVHLNIDTTSTDKNP